MNGQNTGFARDVIALPLRVGVCATRLGFRITEWAATAALTATGRLIRLALPGAANGEEPWSATWFEIAPPSQPEPSSAARPARRQSAPIPPSTPAPPTTPSATGLRAAPKPAPAHVSEELRFVEAFAEPGAEDGAGAAVHVEEPWKGYAQLTANEVIARLAQASREGLGAVALYEAAHRRRQTVLAATQHQLRQATNHPTA